MNDLGNPLRDVCPHPASIMRYGNVLHHNTVCTQVRLVLSDVRPTGCLHQCSRDLVSQFWVTLECEYLPRRRNCDLIVLRQRCEPRRQVCHVSDVVFVKELTRCQCVSITSRNGAGQLIQTGQPQAWLPTKISRWKKLCPSGASFISCTPIYIDMIRCHCSDGSSVVSPWAYAMLLPK